MTIKPSWIAIAAVIALILYAVFSKRMSGFQNPTEGDTDMKTQICSILNETYNNSKMNFDKIEKIDKEKASVILIHLEAIKIQLAAQGCK